MQAAEARAKAQGLMTAGGRKLGGDLSMLKNLTLAQVPSHRHRHLICTAMNGQGIVHAQYQIDLGQVVVQ